MIVVEPTRTQRLAAWAALICASVLVVLTITLVIRNPLTLLVTIVGLALIGLGGWWLITEPGKLRPTGAVVALVGAGVVLGAVLSEIADAGWRLLALVAVLALIGAVGGGARTAVAAQLHPKPPIAPAPKRPVLIANPKSGGGKVDKFELKAKAEALGVEVVLLTPSDDLEQLARDAIARGADCLGMAGGDGSQALVAAVAVEKDVPFVCISAGTRNHFALDLGLDRDDPGTGLIAFKEGVERRIDYATVNGKLFVNNVSMGVYATIVQEDTYRDAKLETSKELLPRLLGAEVEPFDLQYTDPDGTAVDGAFVILISNNPYVLGPKLDVSQRRSLTTGELGVFAVNARTGKEAAQLVARSTFGVMNRDPRVHQFTAKTFVVTSHSGRAFAGIDGEALDLETPLRFESRPSGLRIRVPQDSYDRLRKRQGRTLGVKDLLRVALGHPLNQHERA